MVLRVGSGPTTPIPTSIAGDSVQPRVPAAEAPRPAPADPFTISLGTKRIQVQEGEFVKIVDKMNEAARIFNSSVRFAVNPKSNHVTVQVVDIDTGVVLREIPPEKLIDTFNRVEDVLGLLVDVRV